MQICIRTRQRAIFNFFHFFSFFGAASVLILRLKFNSVSASLRFFFFKPFFLFFFLHFIFHKRFSSSRKVSSFHLKGLHDVWNVAIHKSLFSCLPFAWFWDLWVEWILRYVVLFVACLDCSSFSSSSFAYIVVVTLKYVVVGFWWDLIRSFSYFIFYNFTQKIVTSGKLLTLVP